MKKILIALIIIVPIAITGFLGYDFFKKNFAHVHGIIMYSDNKDEADTILENNKKSVLYHQLLFYLPFLSTKLARLISFLLS